LGGNPWIVQAQSVPLVPSSTGSTSSEVHLGHPFWKGNTWLPHAFQSWTIVGEVHDFFVYRYLRHPFAPWSAKGKAISFL